MKQQSRSSRRMRKKKILFFCACNATLSQMAEGLLNKDYGERYEAYSAGVKPTQVNPAAIKTMAEIGIDISHHRAKSVESFIGTLFDCIAMVCGGPQRTCPFLARPHEGFTCKGCATCCAFHPFFPKTIRVIHAQFPSLDELADPESLDCELRSVREEIRNWIKITFGQE